jgi:hypothetical protein
MLIDFFMALGIVGMLMILAGFILIQTHRTSPDTLLYDALNFIGSSFLVIYGYVGRAWPFVILNAVFALYSLKDILFDDLGRITANKVIRKA